MPCFDVSSSSVEMQTNSETTLKQTAVLVMQQDFIEHQVQHTVYITIRPVSYAM
jgi:hypothetical protein